MNAESRSLDNPNLKRHLAITLGISLGLVGMVLFCGILFLLTGRGDRKPAQRSNRDNNERLRKLDKVSPTCTLEKWWASTKGKLGLSEAVDGQFVCAVCLEQVDRTHEIRELKCFHVFHRECLEKWFLGDHYNCPLCHRAYFASPPPPITPSVWMV